MRRTAWILALILLPGGSQAASANAQQRGINELLDSAQLWQTRHRPDLARGLLQKVLAVRADEPRALLLLGEIDLRSGRKDAALPQLALLQARHPDSTELRELQQLASLYNNDSLRLSRLQQLREAGRNTEAAALARQIFPSAKPPGMLGADLAGLIASTPGAWDVSRRQAEERVAISPTAANRMALAEVQALRPNTRDQAWETYNLLAREGQLPMDAVASSWRRSIRLQPQGTAVGPLWAALSRAIDGPGAALATAAGPRSASATNPTINGVTMAAAIAALNDDATDALKATAVKPGNGNGNGNGTATASASTSAAQPATAAATPPAPISARERAILQVLVDAHVQLAAGANEQAAKLLEAGLVRNGDDGPTWGLLGLSRMREGQHAEAEPAFARARRLDPDDAERWRSLGVAAHYWATVSVARIEADVGRPEVAADLLRPVIDTQPSAVEAKLLLARLEGELGQDETAIEHFDQVLAIEPKEERAWRGRFTVRLKTDPEAALGELTRYGSGAAEIVDGGAVRDMADARIAQQRSGAALRLLEQAIDVAPTDPWLRHDAARIYLQLGLPDSARTLMAEGRAAAHNDKDDDNEVAMLQASALVALAADENNLAVELVSALPAAEANGPLRDLVRRAHLEQAFGNARDAINAQRPATAQGWLDKADRLVDSSAAQGMRLARLRLGAGQRLHALALLKQIDPVELDPADTLAWAGMVADAGASDLALDRLQARIDANASARRNTLTTPNEPGPDGNADTGTRALAPWNATDLAQARFAHADLAIEANRPQAAREDLQHLASDLPADAHAERLRLLRLQRRVSDTNAARATLADLLLHAGDDPAVRLEAARQARSDADDAAALRHLQLARERSAPGSDTAAEASRVIDTIDAERQPLLEMALHDASLNGSEGRARLKSREATLRLSWPDAGNGTFFTQLDLIRLDAGTLPAAIAQSEAFGRVLAQSPTGLAAPSAQNDSGGAIGAGWSNRNDSVDIGVAGLRLPNVVGGWAHTQRRDDGGWSVEVSRRVVTSSLLSWAGAQDPSDDNKVWGGVTLNALTLRTEHVLSEADTAYASLRFGLLQGRNVANNQTRQLRAGIDHDLQRADDHRLRIGLNASSWIYTRNLSFHTFGQGGYYSPQRYASIGLPLEAAGLYGPLSYQVRASLSHSWTREDDTPYYPTDPAAQAAAGNPIHTGGPGGGMGAALRAVLEWRVAPKWAIGTVLALEHSSDYSPARVSIYMRHWMGRVPAPLDWPPQPLTPYLRN